MDDKTWLPVTAAANEIGPGEMRGVALEGVSVAIYNVDGKFYATSNICTHAITYLTDGWLEGNIIECPLHAGQFDVTTGKGLCAPITSDLQTYPIRIIDNQIHVCVNPVAAE
jgi:nitrite reductase/ring-hydroxylating ferredoxin subunit